MALFWLPDEAWAAIEPHLPKNQPSAQLVDDRRVISGILQGVDGQRDSEAPVGGPRQSVAAARCRSIPMPL